MNCLATPTLRQIQRWAPLPSVLSNEVYEYLGNPFITLWLLPAESNLRLPLPRSVIVHEYGQSSNENTRAKEILVYDFVVDWGDGSTSHITAYDQPEASHFYKESGHYTIHMTGQITGLSFGQYFTSFGLGNSNNPRYQLLDISQWGCLRLRSGFQAFAHCEALTGISASDAPQLDDLTDASYMFACCPKFNGDLNQWDTSRIVNMQGMFNYSNSFNGSLIHWKTGSVTDMSHMFSGCSSFNGDLSRWDTGSVKNMSYMFARCTRFDGNLSEWKTSDVTDMNNMFMFCSAFKGSVGNWDTQHVEDTSGMFSGCSSFRDDLSRWDTSSVKNMERMFSGCSLFDGDLSGWSTSRLYSFTGMFDGCVCFKGNLSRNLRNIRRRTA